MNQERLFFIRVVTSFNNEGDLLINRALIKAFSSYGQVVIDKNASPDFFVKRLILGVQNCKLEARFYSTLFSSIFTKKTVYLLTIPGHFFGAGVKKAIQTFLAAVFFYLLKLLGVKVIKLGGCVGPFDTSVRLAERFRSGAFVFYGLRDSISIDNIGMSQTNNAYPDLAFMSSDIDEIVSQTDIDKNIVISFREATNSMAKASGYQAMIKEKIPLLLEKYKENHTIYLVFQVPSDKGFNQEIYEMLSDLGFKCEFVSEKLKLQDALQLYANANIVMSNRLHILLPCIGLGTKHAGIIDTKKHHKIYGIYKDIGLEELLIDFESTVDNNTLDDLSVRFPTELLLEKYKTQNHLAKSKLAALIQIDGK